MKPLNVVIIGAGNVARHLGKGLISSSHKVIQVYNHHISTAEMLSQELHSTPVSEISQIDSTADIYIIAIKDDAIQLIADTLPQVKGIVVHTSGTVNADIFADKFKNHGVLYPLYTFKKDTDTDLSKVPFFITGNNTETEQVLEEIVDGFGATTNKISDEQRHILHVAAVFANNFTNHMFSICESLLKEQNIPFNVMLPLINKTIENLHAIKPVKAQTGPAVRGDEHTIQSHLNALSSHPEYQKIYAAITDSIIKTKNVQ